MRHTTPRKRSYGLDVEQVVGVVWEALDYVCVERLRPALLSTARQLQRFDELRLSPKLEQQLTSISQATLQRMTTRMRCERIRLPRKGPSEANRARQQIPMRRLQWDTREAGHFEVDLVHHCGESSAGEYIHSLQMVDVATGWSERVAVMGRGQAAMQAGFEAILGRLPFSLLQLHPETARSSSAPTFCVSLESR